MGRYYIGRDEQVTQEMIDEGVKKFLGDYRIKELSER